MNVKVDKQENSKVVLEFTMDKETFEKELDKAFHKNAKYFKVPGFRNGKVPRNVVEKVYGEGVLYETVIEDNVDDEYRKAVEDNKLEVVSKPELDVKQIGKGKDLIYTVTLFVKPEATVKKYKGLEVKKIDSKVSKKEVDAAIESDRQKNARVVSVDDRDLQKDDISTIDFEGFVDGVAFEGGKAENFELTIGSGQFIPGFEDQLIGMKIGEEKEINVTFPKEYHAENLAGKPAMFKVKLISIKSKILPELDDEFAKDVSEFETLADYRKDVEKKVKKQKEESAKNQKEIAVIDKLVENTEVVIPESMIDDEVESMSNQFASNLAYQGLDLKTYCMYMNTTEEEFKKNLRPEAEKNVKLKLALDAIEKLEEIKVEAKEIDEKIDELKKQYGSENTNDDLNKNENVRHYMEEKIKQDKLMKIIVDSAIEK
ncbi:trigger factor [Clostridium sp. CAG:465]|nr:trigger factor [Clostridium sp. CAG:465]